MVTKRLRTAAVDVYVSNNRVLASEIKTDADVIFRSTGRIMSKRDRNFIEKKDNKGK